ncbi:MAG: hypothetical protein FGM33_06475 [Candidatus Kapabacteria bacterium]|nr:hypothetical protein [Candidatus Kapabacteria bacterium]
MLRLILLVCLSVCTAAIAAVSAPYYEGRIRVTFRDSARGKDIPITIIYAADSASGDNRPLVGTGTKNIPTFGVVVVGHGYQMPVTAYKSLATTICKNSRNFIAVLPETGTGLFPNHNDFALDMASTVAYMQREGKRKGSIWEGHIRNESVLAGHSMGGGASFLAAKSLLQSGAATLTGVIAFAPAETNPSSSAAAASVTCPTLILAGGVDCVTPLAGTVQPIYDKLPASCKVLAVIPGASHCQFADVNSTCNLGELNCRATITRDVQFERCWKYVNSFLDRTDDFSRVIENTQVQTTMLPLASSELKFDRSTFCVNDTIRVEYVGDPRDVLWLPDSARGKQYVAIARGERVTISAMRTTCFGTTRVDTSIAVIPRPQVEIKGARSMCPGDSIVLRAASNASAFNPLSVRWSTSETSDQIVVRRAGVYSVEVASPRGCGAVSAFATVDIVEVPDIRIRLVGDSVYCDDKGQVVATLQGDVDRVRDIVWSTGDATSELRLTKAGTYELYARMVLRDSLACPLTSDTVSLSIRRYSATIPTILVESDTLTSTPADTYQWSVDGEDISGASQRVHVARRTGRYRVTTSRSDEGGCAATSEPRSIVVSSVTENFKPNPVIRQMLGSILIMVTAGSHTVEVQNVRGQVVLSRRYEASEGQPIAIDTSVLATDPFSVHVDGQALGLFVPLR